MSPKPFIFFGGAELPWIYPLGVELAKFGPVSMVRLGASLTPLRKVQWPFEDNPDGLHKMIWTYPPGFNGKLSLLFIQIIRSRLEKIINALQNQCGSFPFIIISDPKFEKYTYTFNTNKIIYLNYDDYSISRKGTDPVLSYPEQRLINKSGTILCSSRYQSLQFKQQFQNKANAIFHFPHGVHESFINTSAEISPERDTVCAIGAMTARYDWKLIHEVISRLANIGFLFCGEIGLGEIGLQRKDWHHYMERVLKLPNVQHIRGLRHRETASIYRSSSINWMPYYPDLPFVQASCPLKLTDGIASGRPVISAHVPECRLYPSWVSIYQNADEAIALISNALKNSKNSDSLLHRDAQIRFARDNTWAVRAEQLLEILERDSISTSDGRFHH